MYRSSKNGNHEPSFPPDWILRTAGQDLDPWSPQAISILLKDLFHLETCVNGNIEESRQLGTACMEAADGQDSR